jgi:branched-chain amino acid transport system permease protein
VTAFLQYLVLGLLVGGVYALVASGLSLVFGVMKIINIAHGAFLILGAFLAYTIWSWLNLDPLLGIVIVAPLMFLLGWGVYWIAVRPVRLAPIASTVLLTFGIALVAEAVMGFAWGNNMTSIQPSYTSESFHIGGIYLPKTQVYGGAIAIGVLAFLGFMLTRTWLGRAIRAAAINPSGAALIGIKPVTVSALVFGIGTAAAGTGGAIVGVLYSFVPGTHYIWIARLLAIVVLGGLGSLNGAVLGAVIFGLAETFTAAYISPAWATAVPYLIVFIVLLVRPQGLMGSRLREDSVAA